MCRLLFLPKGVTKPQALGILKKMYGDNEHPDGTGEAYVNNDGKFVVNKYKHSLPKVLKKNREFLNHLPHNSWTIVHLRKMSIGHVSQANAQPFKSLNEKICLAHNGTLGGTYLLSMYLQTLLGYGATSDSAAATELISRIGLRNFNHNLEFGGVFGILNTDGSLEISKLSGTLQLHLLENETCILASEFDDTKYENRELARGWYKFTPDGKYLRHTIKKFHWSGFTEEDEEEWNGVQYVKNGLTPMVPKSTCGGATSKSDVWHNGEQGNFFCGI